MVYGQVWGGQLVRTSEPPVTYCTLIKNALKYFADEHNYEIARDNPTIASKNVDVHGGSPRVTKTVKTYMKTAITNNLHRT